MLIKNGPTKSMLNFTFNYLNCIKKNYIEGIWGNVYIKIAALKSSETALVGPVKGPQQRGGLITEGIQVRCTHYVKPVFDFDWGTPFALFLLAALPVKGWHRWVASGSLSLIIHF